MMCGTASSESQEFLRGAERSLVSGGTSGTNVAATDKAVLKRLRPTANLQLSCREMFLPKELTDLLLSFSAAKCSDDHDMLYALNSLSMASLPISYRRPVEDLYIELAYTEATHEPSILLSIAGAHPSPSHLLPSWTPDWREFPLYEPSTSRCFDSAYRSKIKWSQVVSIDGKILTVMGTRIDDVAIVSSSSTIGAWTKFYVSCNCQPQDEAIPGLALMKTLTRARGGLYRLSTDQHAVLLQLVAQVSSEANTSDSGIPRFAQRFLEEARETMRGRTCFVTNSGAFGMGPERIRPGDILIRIPDSPGLTAF
jgi:hypothetical protein